MIHSSRAFYLFMLLTFYCFGLKAETLPLYPLLSNTTIDSVRTLLLQSQPDTNRVNLLLQLSEYYLYRPEENQVNLDSAYLYIEPAESLSNSLHYDKGQIRSLCISGLIHYRKGMVEQAKLIVLKTLTLGKKQGNKQLAAEGWYYLGQVYRRTEEELPLRIRYYEQSLELYRQIGDKKNEAYMLKTIADMHHVQGKSALALSELLQVLGIYRSINYKKLHYTYDLLCTINRRLGNYNEALKYGLASIESARAVKDTVDIGLFYRRIGLIYGDLKQWEAGEIYLKKALKYYQHKNNISTVLHVAEEISMNLLAQKQGKQALDFFQKVIKDYPPSDVDSRKQAARNLADCYLYLKQYTLAEKYYLEMLRIEETTNEKDYYKLASYRSIANFYISRRQYNKARFYLNKAITINSQVGSLVNTSDIHLMLFKVDTAQANFQTAISHYIEYKALDDSIFNETKSKQIASLQIQYETQKKDQDIKLKEQSIILLIKQNQVQQASIREREFQRNAFILGTSMLLLLSGLIYNQYRIKQRSNEQLQIQQKEISQKNISLQHLLDEKEWLLKEVHHRVKNNLHTVMSLLESQSAYLENDALTAIRNSQHRVHAMSLIHQKLYLSDKATTIDMSVYLRELVNYLRDSFDTRQRIHFQLQLETIELDVSQAIPLGLILNEAITNALKYAFPNRMDGLIIISITQEADDQFLLTVADNGIGLPADFDPAQTSSLGMRLMQGLSKEINAHFSIESKKGTVISIVFTVERVLQHLQLSISPEKMTLQA